MSDDRAQLRARFTVPADRDLPPGRHFLHRENLMSQILNDPPAGQPGGQPGNGEPSRSRRKSPWRPSTRGLLATAAAVALVAGAAVTVGEKVLGPGGSAKPAAAASAAPAITVTAVLDRAARAASAQPAVRIGPNQDFYVKAKVITNFPQSKLSAGTLLEPAVPPPSKRVSQVVEGWIAQSQAKETRWKAGGQRSVLGPRAGFFVFGAPFITMDADVTAKPTGGSILYPTYAYLQSLPTNPRRLLNLIEQQIPAASPDKRSGTFLVIEQLLATTILPPQTAAALYRAAALIPGMTIIPDVTDALGRHGVGISIHEDVYKSDEEVWIFSKSTYQFLGVRQRAVVPGPHHETHTLVSAVLAHGVADRPGGIPKVITRVK